MVAVSVQLSNPVSGLIRTTTTDKGGTFVFRNVPPNPYQLKVSVQGFQPLQQGVDVHGSVPIEVTLTLQLTGATSSVDVVAEELVERDPTAHTDIDQSLINKMPIESSSGLNSVVMNAAPGVVADSNGFFHPLGDHAQTQFSIDNQPVTDQQSRIYSNQISPDAVQSMEVITGVAPAEFGDKSSLVVQIMTKSGLDSRSPRQLCRSATAHSPVPTADVTLGGGSHTVGNFLSVSGMRTDRFLDPPEFQALHDHGTSGSFFDRVDAHPSDTDAFHLNVRRRRSSFDVPNTLDQAAAGQAQHQTDHVVQRGAGLHAGASGRVPSWRSTAIVRQDHVIYTPSADPFSPIRRQRSPRIES